MSHVKQHYRMVDGKAVYIHDYENKVLKQQHPEHPQAQLHERTAVGKHKDGSWYLRATDSEDRGHIQEAADKHSIKADWRKAAAKHHGRTGVYDHAHVKGAPEAHQVMEELRSKAATAEQGTKAETSKATKEYQAAVDAHKEAAGQARKAGLHGEAEHHEAQAQRWAALKGIKEDSEKTLSDFAGALKRYEEHPASKGGKHLDTDEIREIVMGYRGNRTDAAAVIHEDVSAFNKQLFAHRMALPVESPGETVTFLAGGGGSGKGIASKAFGLGNMSHTVVDGVLGNFEKADKMIQAAVASGRRAEIVMVHAPIERAVKNMVGRAVRNDYGRIVSLKAMAEGHRGAQETMRKLIEKYGVDGSKGVHLSIVDNSAGEVATAKMLLDKDEMLKALQAWKYGEDMPDRIEKSYNEAKAGHLEDHAKELRGVAEPLNPGESYGKHGEPKHQSRIHHVLGALDSTLADLRAHSGRGPEGAGRDAAGAVQAQREAGQGDRGAGGADEGEGRRRGLKKAFSPADIREALGTINNRAIQLHQAGTSIRNLIKGMDDLPETASFREACKAYAECGGTREDGEKVIEAATRGHRRTAPFMKAMLGEVMADTSTPKSIEPDIQDQTIGQDTMDENSGRDMAKAHPDGYTQESRTINERMKTQEAQIPHQFERAKWTSPNGHPRCLICGDEEPEDGECPGLGGREVAKAWDTQRRKDLKEGKIKGAFAGPDESFPIAGPEDVKNAWNLAGHAADPDAVRKRIVAIAKEHGWESHLPTGGDGLLSPEERAADPRQVAKAHVAEHDRHLASGKVAHVQAYDNNKHPGHMTFEEFRKSPHAPKVTKILQLYTSEQRASHAASHRLHHRQRESIGEQFWTRDDHHGQGVAYRTREAALRAAHEEHIQRANSGTTSDEQAARGADIATGKVDPANYFEHHAKAMDATEAVDSWRKGKDPDNLTPAEHAEAAKLERKAAEAHKAAGYFITHGKPHTIGLVDPLVKKAGLHFGTAQQHERNAKWHEAEAAKASPKAEEPKSGHTFNAEHGPDNPDPRPGHYYVSAMDGDKKHLLAGPWPTHKEALDQVEKVRDEANRRDGRAAFMGFGTARQEHTEDPHKTPLGKMEPEGVHRYQWMRNKEGGQKFGNQAEIRHLTEELYNKHVKNKVKGQMPFAEYKKEYPDATHISIFKTDGGEWMPSGVGAESDLIRGMDPVWAKKVDSFESPEAKAHGSTADSEHQADPVASYPRGGTTQEVRSWGHSNHEALSRMAKEATAKAKASGKAEDHEEAAKLHDYARFAHLYARKQQGPAGSREEDPHAAAVADHGEAHVHHQSKASEIRDKESMAKAHPSAIEALEHAREAKNRANNEDHAAAATQAHNASRKAVEASHRANETEEPDAHAEAMVENHNAKDAHERARRKAVNPRTKESHEAAITGHLKAAEHHFEMRNPHQVTLPEAIAEEDHKNGMTPQESDHEAGMAQLTAHQHSKGLDMGGGTVPSAEAHYAAHEAHQAAADTIRAHGKHLSHESLSHKWGGPEGVEKAARDHEARAAHHKFMGDAMMRARQANGRKMKKAFEDEAQTFLCFDSFVPYLQHRSLFKAHVREHYRTEGGKEIFVRQHERKAKDRMHYVRHTPTGTAGFHWAPDQEGAARSFAGKERLYNDIEAYPVDPELQTGEREGVNGALILGGMDGNGRFPTVSNALAKIGGLLGQYGFEWDDVLTADRFRYPSGSATIPIARTNQLDSFSPIPLDNTGLHLSWYRLVEGKKFGGQDSYEVIAYLG